MLLPLILGLVTGSIYGLTSMGLVLTYRTSGIFNLAHGAVGMAGSYFFFELWQKRGLPLGVALALTLGLFAPALGSALYYAIFRRVVGRSIAVSLVATIAVLLALQGIVAAVYGSEAHPVPSLFPDESFDVASFSLSLQQVGTGLVTAAIALLLLAYLQWTSLGLRTRAVVDNVELAELTGEPSERIQLLSWVYGTVLSCLAGILISQFVFLTVVGLTLVVIQAMAAAVVGRLASLPLTYVGGLGLGIVEKLMAHYLPKTELASGLRLSVSFLVLYGTVLLGTTILRIFRDTQDIEGGYGGILGREVDRARLLPLFVIFAAVAAGLVTAPSYLRFLITAGLIASVALQGFVLITGLGGQVSLCQGALLGSGAVAFGRAMSEWHWPVLAGFFLAGAVALAVGLAVSLPAIRVRGLPLALLTLAVGLFMDNFVFKTPLLAGSFVGYRVPRFEVFGLDIGSDQLFPFFVLAAALLAALVVRNIGSGRTGRLLVAIKNAELAAESFGTSVRRAKLLLFSMAAVLAGLAGALHALLLQQVSASDYNLNVSITYLAVAILGGVGSAQGAVAGGLALYLVPEAIRSTPLSEYTVAVFGIGAAVVLIARQGGLGDLISRPILAAVSDPGTAAPRRSLSGADVHRFASGSAGQTAGVNGSGGQNPAVPALLRARLRQRALCRHGLTPPAGVVPGRQDIIGRLRGEEIHGHRSAR